MNRVCYYIDVGNRMQENVRTKIAAGAETEKEGKLLLLLLFNFFQLKTIYIT